jgi:hypothetical protein
MGTVTERSRIKQAIAVNRQTISCLLTEAAGITFRDRDGSAGHRAADWHIWRLLWFTGGDGSQSARNAFEGTVIADEFLDYVPRAAHSRVPAIEVAARRAMGRCSAAAQYWREAVDADAMVAKCAASRRSGMADMWGRRSSEAHDKCRCAVVEATDAIANYRFLVRRKQGAPRTTKHQNNTSTQED